MKNTELFAFQAGLYSVGNLTGVKFTYAVSKNLRTVRAECAILSDTLKPSAAMQAYDRERLEICKSHCLKENGAPKMTAANSFEIDPDRQEEFDAAMEALKEDSDHKAALEARETQIEEYNAMLLEEIAGIKIHMLPLEHVPEEITAAQMESIFDMIEEE